MSSIRSRPRSSSAAPLEDEDLLSEILLRLPPLPSSLPRASLACKPWGRIVSDARFLRRFRKHHRRNPHLLCCFVRGMALIAYFEPMLEAPNRFPQDRFSFPIGQVDTDVILGCRHGLVLIFLWRRNQLLVWDPVTGDRHHLDIPPGFDKSSMISGAVLRSARVAHHFQVVLVGNSSMQHTQSVASMYSSDTRVWSNLVSTLLPADDPDDPTGLYHGSCSVMVGNSLYWLLRGNLFAILEFNLDRQSLSVIHVPVDIVDLGYCSFTVMRAEGGGLGFLFLSGYCVQLWKRTTDCDGVASWVLGRTVALDKLLSMNSEEESQSPKILGFAEDNNVMLLWTFIGVFIVQFESLQFKKLLESDHWDRWFQCHPFKGVYTADSGIGDGHDGDKLLHII